MSIEGAYLNLIKDIHDKLMANIILKGKTKRFHCKSWNETRISTITISVQNHTQNKAREIGKRKHKSNRKERSPLIIWRWCCILHRRPKKFSKRLVALTAKFSNVAQSKINTPKWITFLYTSNALTEKPSFTIAERKIKYLGNNLSRKVKKTSTKKTTAL